MKKIVAVIFAFVMCLTLCSCSSVDDNESTTQKLNDIQTESPTEIQPEETEEESTTSKVEEPTEESENEPASTVHTHSWKKATCLSEKTCYSQLEKSNLFE